MKLQFFPIHYSVPLLLHKCGWGGGCYILTSFWGWEHLLTYILALLITSKQSFNICIKFKNFKVWCLFKFISLLYKKELMRTGSISLLFSIYVYSAQYNVVYTHTHNIQPHQQIFKAQHMQCVCIHSYLDSESLNFFRRLRFQLSIKLCSFHHLYSSQSCRFRSHIPKSRLAQTMPQIFLHFCLLPSAP